MPQSLKVMTAETGSSEPWIGIADLALATLQTKQLLTEDQRRTLRDFLAEPVPDFPLCSREHFARCMRSLTVLPRAKDDEVKGELRLALYWRKLGHYSESQWSFAVNVALDRHGWFPTIKELRKCLEAVRSPEQRFHDARALAHRALLESAKAWYGDLVRKGRAGELRAEEARSLPVRTRQLLVEDRVFAAADLGVD